MTALTKARRKLVGTQLTTTSLMLETLVKSMVKLDEDNVNCFTSSEKDQFDKIRQHAHDLSQHILKFSWRFK